jgi:hypothetical protein
MNVHFFTMNISAIWGCSHAELGRSQTPESIPAIRVRMQKGEGIQILNVVNVKETTAYDFRDRSVSQTQKSAREYINTQLTNSRNLASFEKRSLSPTQTCMRVDEDQKLSYCPESLLLQGQSSAP